MKPTKEQVGQSAWKDVAAGLATLWMVFGFICLIRMLNQPLTFADWVPDFMRLTYGECRTVACSALVVLAFRIGHGWNRGGE